jgi:hypothetical protein
MDPMMTAVAAAVAGKLTESLTVSAKTALANLVKLVRKRFTTDATAQQALTAAEQAPDDTDRITALASQLQRLAAADPEFAKQLRTLWSEAGTHLHAETGGVVNEVSGNVAGHVVQARDVQGGISFGTAPNRSGSAGH